jgi:ATP-binding cassette subfamily C (CFTR/MRP) protein 1
MRAPLILFPFVLSTIADATVSFGRLVEFLTAEELGEPYTLDFNQESAVSVDGDFEWEVVPKLGAEDEKEEKLSDTAKMIKELEEKKAKKLEEKKRRKEEKSRKKSGPIADGENGIGGSSLQPLPISVADVIKDTNKVDEPIEKPFALNGLHLTVPKGAFVAIVGRVGSGKVYAHPSTWTTY